MFEILLPTEYIAPYSPMGPGPTTIKNGDATLGFFGEVAAADLFTTAEVSAGVGYFGGVVATVAPVWIKMIIDGVVIYLPKTPLRSGCTWNALYNAKSVYGIKGIGKYPVGAGVAQNAQLTKGDYRFKVRLGSMGGDPMTLPSPRASTTPPYSTSEFARIVNGLVSPKRTADGWGLYDLNLLWNGHVASQTTYASQANYVCTVEGSATLALNAWDKSAGAFLWVPILELTTDATWGNP